MPANARPGLVLRHESFGKLARFDGSEGRRPDAWGFEDGWNGLGLGKAIRFKGIVPAEMHNSPLGCDAVHCEGSPFERLKECDKLSFLNGGKELGFEGKSWRQIHHWMDG